MHSKWHDMKVKAVTIICNLIHLLLSIHQYLIRASVSIVDVGLFLWWCLCYFLFSIGDCCDGVVGIIVLLLLLAAKEFSTTCDANRRKLLLVTVTVTAKLSKNIRSHHCWVCIFGYVYLFWFAWIQRNKLGILVTLKPELPKNIRFRNCWLSKYQTLDGTAILSGECINSN